MKKPPALVFVLFRETNSGNGASDSDGWVQAVYTTQKRAEAELAASYRRARAAGELVKWNPYDPDTDAPEDWTHGWRVEEHEVRK